MTEPGGKAAILIGMAKTAELAGNNVEAISYYNRVLEHDPTVSEAWLGKGRAAGWLSTLANIRLKETTVAFSHAIAAAGRNRDKVAQQALADLTKLGEAVRSMGWNHYIDHAGIDSAWEACVAAQTAVLDAQLATYEWEVPDRDSTELTIRVAKMLLDHGGAPVAEAFARTMYNSSIAIRRKIDPSYEPPALAEVTTTDRIVKEMQAETDRVADQNAVHTGVGIALLAILAIIAIALTGAS